MATSIKMPQLGESVTEGTVGRWLKAVGDRIERDEPLVEIVTDKVNVEVPSTEAGFLVKILAEEGQTVPVGSEIAVLGDAPGGGVEPVPGDKAEPVVPAANAPDAPASASGSAPVAAAPPSRGPAPSGETVRVGAGTGVATLEAPADDDNGPRTSPLVRRLAREHGVALAAVKGTGLGGRVTRDDIMAVLEQRGVKPNLAPTQTNGAAAPAAVATPAPMAAPAARPATEPFASPSAPVAPAPQPAPAPVAAQAGDTWQALTPMRRAIADHMVRSVSTAPHVSMCIEIDVTGVAKRRAAAQAEFKAREGFELTYLPFMAKAVIEAVREHPVLNARFQAREDGQQGILLHGQLNLGIAVGLDAGLVVPVIRNADSLNIAGLARAVRDLATRARSSKLALDDLKGGTFTLNNTGAFGSISSNPIINDGQAGIITMEAVVRRPVVVNRDGEEAIVVRSMMNSCLTFDHRVLDGLQAGRFLQSVKRRLEAVGPDTPLY